MGQRSNPANVCSGGDLLMLLFACIMQCSYHSTTQLTPCYCSSRNTCVVSVVVSHVLVWAMDCLPVDHHHPTHLCTTYGAGPYGVLIHTSLFTSATHYPPPGGEYLMRDRVPLIPCGWCCLGTILTISLFGTLHTTVFCVEEDSRWEEGYIASYDS